MNGPADETAPEEEMEELVIFDCDGVLVDSERLSIDVVRSVFAEAGWEISPQEIIGRFLGTSVANVRSHLEERLGGPVPEGWEEELHARHREVFSQHLQAVPEVHGAIRALGDRPRCVASSSSPERIRHSLQLTGLWDEFFESHIFSASMVERGKPAPDLFLHAAGSLGFRPEQCVVVEDSRYGVQAARSAGMRALGFAGGLTPPEWLAEAGAIVFHDMKDLPALIRSRARG